MEDQHTFNITINEKEQEVKMTFGLLNELCGMCGDHEDALMFALNTDLRAEALRLMLSTRDNQGKITKEANFHLMDMDPEAVSDLLDWAGAHTLDFFLKAAERTKKTSESRQERMKALVPSSNGGEA